MGRENVHAGDTHVLLWTFILIMYGFDTLILFVNYSIVPIARIATIHLHKSLHGV